MNDRKGITLAGPQADLDEQLIRLERTPGPLGSGVFFLSDIL
ncbi:MAG: hypothetical protein AB7V18_05670 [Pyrinomonadaceae bacterium]